MAHLSDNFVLRTGVLEFEFRIDGHAAWIKEILSMKSRSRIATITTHPVTNQPTMSYFEKQDAVVLTAKESFAFS